MKLLDLLKQPSYSGSVVIAGENGLTRTVQSVNMMDAPDIIDFLKPDELLLTTAYLLKDIPDALLSLVAKMAEHGCAGLGVRTKRFLGEIPPDIILLANRLSFPIIELPPERALGELINSSLNTILEKRTDELRYAFLTHRTFSQLVMKGKGISSILESLSDLLHCTAILLDDKLEPIANSRNISLKKNEDLIQAIRDEVEKLDNDSQVPVPLTLPLIEPPWKQAAAYPITTTQKRSWLLLFAPVWEDETIEQLTVEQAVNVLGFELLKRQAVKERSRRYKNDFFADWVEGRVNTEQELMNRGKSYGLHTNSIFQCIVCKNDALLPKLPSFSEERLQAERDHLYANLKRTFTKAELPFILFNKNDLFIFVLTKAESSHDFEKKLLRHLEVVQNQLLRSLKCSFSFGVGKPSDRSMELPTVYKEALEALQSGYAANENCFIRTYRAKDMLDLLRRIPISDLNEFYIDTFQHLLQAENKDKQELMQTLRTYVENEGQIAETAKRLFLHRNTVIYRIDKCERLTRRNLKDSSDTMRIRLAFQIETLLS